MSLLFRTNLALIAVFALGATASRVVRDYTAKGGE
jgi:hypothetical protein